MGWRENGRHFRTNKMKVTDKFNKQVLLTFCLKEQMLPQAHKRVKNKKLLSPNFLQKNGTNMHPVTPPPSTSPQSQEPSSVSSTPHVSQTTLFLCCWDMPPSSHSATHPAWTPEQVPGWACPSVLPFSALPQPPSPPKHISSCWSIFRKPFRDLPLPSGSSFF